MTTKKSVAEWVATVDLAYPGNDGNEHRAAQDALCENAAEDWPPQWVIDAGYVRPANNDREGDK
jgi:hypothetical protein